MSKNFKTLFDSAVLIALFTAFAYMSAFYYWNGYLKFYGLTTTIISISVGNILATLNGMMPFIGICMVGSLFIVMFFSRFSAALKERTFAILIIFTFFCFISMNVLYELEKDAMYYISIGIIIIVIWLFMLIFPFINYKETKGYKNKFIKQLRMMDETLQWAIEIEKNRGQMFWRRPITFTIIILILSAFVIARATMSEFGAKDASDKDNYLVCPKYNNSVVIYQNDTTCILMKQLSDHQLARVYQFVDPTELGELIYSETGPLTVIGGND
ncbi:MAG: hypothetical protein C0413_02170 [Clostridiales bacterium]|nr:hypothetical protein [Clostridiales bacterium]